MTKCPLCNTEMVVKACRVRCLNCGYQLDCEDGGFPLEGYDENVH